MGWKGPLEVIWVSLLVNTGNFQVTSGCSQLSFSGCLAPYLRISWGFSDLFELIVVFTPHVTPVLDAGSVILAAVKNRRKSPCPKNFFSGDHSRKSRWVQMYKRAREQSMGYKKHWK